MNTLNPYLKQYKKNEVETASPEKILIMLYDGAINFLNQAKTALENGDDDLFHKKNTSCKNIIVEFMDTLDLEQGGEWALSLYNLYKYLRKILIKADIGKDVSGLDEVLKHLTSLRETWVKAIEIAKEERTLMPSREDLSHSARYEPQQTQQSVEYYDGDEYESNDDGEDDDDEEEYEDE